MGEGMNESAGKTAQDQARARFEQEQMGKNLRMVQVLVAVQLVVLVALAYGLWDAGRRIQQTTNEVNGLRENIQNLFSSNVPLVERLNSALTNANDSADQLNSQLSGDSGIDSQMDEAMSRMEDEMPKILTKVFEKEGPNLMKGSLHDPSFQSDAREQVSEIIKDSMNDPSVKDEMASAMRNALKSGLTKKQ